MYTTIDNPALRAALDRLFSLQTFGIKLGLEPITALLDEIGNPHHRFPAIHVAGTNGKGSVCAMIASILGAAGLRVGLYSSPHLVSFDERIRVDGIPIDQQTLARYAEEMLPIIERHNCTFFEGTTAMGFRYFADMEVDVAVVETGLGGRLDATNVLSPVATAITSISFDHVKHLGNTLEKIAWEKAGIIKSNAPAIVGNVAPRLREIFSDAATQAGTEVRFVDDFCRAVYHDMSFDGIVASFMVDRRELPRVRIDLVGRHQIENARVALGTIESVREQFGVTDEAIRDGMGAVRRMSGIRGRFESVRNRPRMILDVAHNPDGARVLVETLNELRGATDRGVRFVYGAVQDKDVADVVRILAPIADRLYAVRADSHRSLPADEIAYRSEQAGITTVLCQNVAEGIERGMADAGPDDVIVVCGSFYVVADAVLHLRTMEPTANGGMAAEPAPSDQSGDLRVAEQAALDRISSPSDMGDTVDAGPGQEIHTRRLTMREWGAGEQPRERLMQRGAQALSDAELIAILLRTGMKGADVIEVSRQMMRRFTTLTDLSERDYKELEMIPGVGPAKAVTLAAAFEIGRRLKAEPFASRPLISGPEDIARMFRPKLRSVQKEQFHVVLLNTANRVIRTTMVSEGNLNSSIVHPREVFRTAIIERAASVIGLHNHPSGNPTPSKEDITITKQLVESGRILNIPFHDHVIIAGEEYVSMAEKGYI